jgi:hypothetical protein
MIINVGGRAMVFVVMENVHHLKLYVKIHHVYRGIKHNAQ